MPTPATASMVAHFQELEDPRIRPATRHPLLDMVAIAMCAVICGADTWVEVEASGRAIVAWLRTFLALPHDIPSHDTFGRVFAALDPDQVEAGFHSWVAAVAATTHVAVAIDGRTLRRSHDARQGKDALVLVSAWAEHVLALKENQPTLWSAVDTVLRRPRHGVRTGHHPPPACGREAPRPT